MRGINAIAGVALLMAVIAGGAALALAQQSGGPPLPPPGPIILPVELPVAPPLVVPPAGQAAPPALPTLVNKPPMPPGPIMDPVPGNPPVNTGTSVPIQPVAQVQAAPVVIPSAPGFSAMPQPPAVPQPDGNPPATPVGPVPMHPVPTQPITPTPPITPMPPITPLPDPGNDIRLVPSAQPSSPASEPAAEGPIGRQEPSVSLEWIGPPTAKLGQPTDYALVVRNPGSGSVQMVQVKVRIPNGLTVADTAPRAGGEARLLTWDLGTLLARQEKSLQIRLVGDARGDVLPTAWVTFTGSSVMRIRVREPKLVLKASAPEKTLSGESAPISLTVSNPGDGAADQVKIHAVLGEGLENAKGKDVLFDIGTLAAGESRTVQVLAGTRLGGTHHCEAIAEAEGGLSARDGVNVLVTLPKLELQIVGPGLRYLERKAIYTLKVTNSGDAPASNVIVGDVVPEGFKVLAASDGGRHDFASRTVSWAVGELGPGQTKQVQVEVQAVNPGVHKHKATAIAARGVRADSETVTRVEGLSAIMMEVVDLEDPIEVGGEEIYEIKVTNTGSKTENDIRLVIQVPDKMEFKSAESPVRYTVQNGTVTFDPIERLVPKGDAIVRVHAKALQPGSVRFKVQLTSASLTEPVTKEESTRIYSDAPEAARPGQ